jgi:hypothetical protein
MLGSVTCVCAVVGWVGLPSPQMKNGARFLVPRDNFYFDLQSQSSSPIKNAAVNTVVHNPRLSPTADCVIFIVRTILFEIR